LIIGIFQDEMFHNQLGNDFEGMITLIFETLQLRLRIDEIDSILPLKMFRNKCF